MPGQSVSRDTLHCFVIFLPKRLGVRLKLL